MGTEIKIRNRERAEQVIASMLAEDPEKFDMGCCFNTCGTPACIAGHAAACAGYKPDRSTLLVTTSSGKLRGVSSAATQWLEIEYSDGHSLFSVSRWPDSFRDEYMLAFRERRYADARDVAIRLIRESIMDEPEDKSNADASGKSDDTEPERPFCFFWK